MPPKKPPRPEAARIQAGPGGPPPEEVGAANVGFAEAQDEIEETEPDLGPPEYAPGDYESLGEYQSPGEFDDLMYGPSTGLGLKRRPYEGRRMPSDVVRYLPLMAKAVQEPDAPQGLRLLYRALVNKLEEEMRGR